MNVVVSSDSAAGASSAPNTPCSARAATSTPKLSAAPPSAEAHGEAGEADDEGALAAEEVAEAAAEQQQAAEGERVGGDDPLAVVVGEAEVLLRGGQRDVHDRRVEHDHQLRDADEREDQPAALVMSGLVWGSFMGSWCGKWRVVSQLLVGSVAQELEHYLSDWRTVSAFG